MNIKGFHMKKLKLVKRKRTAEPLVAETTAGSEASPNGQTDRLR